MESLYCLAFAGTADAIAHTGFGFDALFFKELTMHDMTPSEATQTASRDSRAWAEPSSSRMLTTYLSDVEQMLDEHRWDLAMRDALDLPAIAVALSDPTLTASTDRCMGWCDSWLKAEAVDSEGDHGRISGMIAQRTTADSESIPSTALRRLRLRRHARNAPRGFNAVRNGESQHATEAIEVCTTLVEGMRRWYAHSACHDPVAQANLARLAVLR